MLIAVVGSGECSAEVAAAAEAVGRELALRGAIVVCGGYAGVMEAACRGARQAGGHTIGILGGRDPSEANPYVEFSIATGIGHARNTIVALSGAAVIAIDGAFGTLSEIAFALIYGTPVFGLGTWKFSHNGRGDTEIIRASDPLDAVEKALAAAKSREPHRSM